METNSSVGWHWQSCRIRNDVPPPQTLLESPRCGKQCSIIWRYDYLPLSTTKNKLNKYDDCTFRLSHASPSLLVLCSLPPGSRLPTSASQSLHRFSTTAIYYTTVVYVGSWPASMHMHTPSRNCTDPSPGAVEPSTFFLRSLFVLCTPKVNGSAAPSPVSHDRKTDRSTPISMDGCSNVNGEIIWSRTLLTPRQSGRAK